MMNKKESQSASTANYGVVVKGPPGTGKSHTIANLISRFLG
jgi:Cdc6-like AAA superfamily ATPase